MKYKTVTIGANNGYELATRIKETIEKENKEVYKLSSGGLNYPSTRHGMRDEGLISDCFAVIIFKNSLVERFISRIKAVVKLLKPKMKIQGYRVNKCFRCKRYTEKKSANEMGIEVYCLAPRRFWNKKVTKIYFDNTTERKCKLFKKKQNDNNL